jgi:hypothetical protein
MPEEVAATTPSPTDLARRRLFWVTGTAGVAAVSSSSALWSLARARSPPSTPPRPRSSPTTGRPTRLHRSSGLTPWRCPGTRWLSPSAPMTSTRRSPGMPSTRLTSRSATPGWPSAASPSAAAGSSPRLDSSRAGWAGWRWQAEWGSPSVASVGPPASFCCRTGCSGCGYSSWQCCSYAAARPTPGPRRGRLPDPPGMVLRGSHALPRQGRHPGHLQGSGHGTMTAWFFWGVSASCPASTSGGPRTSSRGSRTLRRVLDRGVRIDPVLVVQVDHVRAETAQ